MVARNMTMAGEGMLDTFTKKRQSLNTTTHDVASKRLPASRGGN